MASNKNKRYITFYKVIFSPLPHFSTYRLTCHRTKKQCIKIGLKHIKQGTAYFFTFRKVKNKKKANL